MSYPPPRSRSSSAADRYRPDDYPPARASPPQAPQANGYLAPGGSPPTAPLAMPEPYQPSPLSNGASNGPAFQPHSLPTHSTSYLHPHGGTPGAPPYPLADPSPRPRSYSNSSQRSYHSQRSGSRRSSHGQQQAQQVRFDDEPEYFEARRPAHAGHRHSHSGASGRRDESPRHHHHHRREEDYNDDYDRRHHHGSSGHSGHGHSHHGRHDSFADDNGGKPLKRTDTHRPTLGDTVVSLVSGLKDYVSR